jgi:exopolyphosphatase/pppGpp-phosphohydrolase
MQARIEQEGKPIPVYGTSGTIKCIARLIASQMGALDRLKGPLTPFTRAELQQFIQSLEGSTREERIQLGLMKRKRVDAVVPGAILLLEMMNLLGVDDMAASVTGLREGIVAAFLRPVSQLHSHPAPLISGEVGSALSALETRPKTQPSDGHVPLGAAVQPLVIQT